MRRLTIAATVAAVTVLSGCTFDVGSDKAVELSAKDLCAMVKPERVEKLFDITVEDVTAPDSGGMNVSSCVYEAERDQPLSQVSTMVESLARGPVGKDALDSAFTAPDGEKHDYEAVDDLGDLAGFGLDPRDPRDIKIYELAVVDDDYTVRVFVECGESETAEVSVDQLRPLAEAILGKWDRP